MVKLAHSYSSMKMYENCPKRYFHQRIEKSVTDPGGPATHYGERVHKALELYLAGEAPELSEETARYKPLCDAIARKAEGGVLTVEEEMTLNENLEPTGWWDSDAWMRSKIDVLIRKGPKAYMFDWKTGKRRPDFAQLELFALQVMLHYPEIKVVTTAFVWLKEDKIDRDTYTRNNYPTLLANMMAKVRRIEQSLENDNWPAKPSGLCGWCPCKDFCEYR